MPQASAFIFSGVWLLCEVGFVSLLLPPIVHVVVAQVKPAVIQELFFVYGKAHLGKLPSSFPMVQKQVYPVMFFHERDLFFKKSGTI